MIARALIALLLAFWGGSAHATDCQRETYAGNKYTVCTVDVAREDLRLFLDDADGQPYGFFSRLDAALRQQGKRLGFAMNAGMYHEDRSPVGYHLENRAQRQGVITSDGPGNFGMLPNGVLCLQQGRADVYETNRFLRTNPDCRDATQSGPMLVIDGELHPRFLRNSTSRFIRNGVGTSHDGRRAIFVISDNPVTFHAFGSYFRDRLKLRNALYFDGNISRLRAPSLGRDDVGFSALGPIIGVVDSAQ